MERRLLILVGPTAVGKTAYSIRLAKSLNGEIISADSMQIYRDLNIGSAKPSSEELAQVPHYMVNVADPIEPWSVARYQSEAKRAIETAFLRGKQPIVSGGTGLYVNSLLYHMNFSDMEKNQELRASLEVEADRYGSQYIHDRLRGLDPVAADRIHPNNRKKIIRAIEVIETSGKGIPDFQNSFQKTEDYNWVMIGLNRDREELYRRIDMRAQDLIRQGLVLEVKELIEKGLTKELTSMMGIGYKEVVEYLNGETTKEGMIATIQRNTRRYAKRQLTWFHRYEDIKWFNLSELERQGDPLSEILSFLSTCGFRKEGS